MNGDSKGMHISRIYGSTPIGYEQLTVDATVGGIALTASKYGTAKSAVIFIEAADIRARIDGGAPTTTLGNPFYADDEIDLYTPEAIANFRAIRTGTTSAVINVNYFE